MTTSPGSRPRRRAGRPPKPLDASASALARLGAQLRQLRLEQGLTLARLGELTGYSWQHLGAVERAKVAPSQDVVAACERALTAGGRLVSLFPAVVGEQAAIRHTREAARHAHTPVPDQDVDWSHLATAAASSSVSAGMVEQLELITDRQRSLYHELTSAQMLVPVEAHLGLLMSLLKATHSDPLRHRIASAASEAAGFAAWIWHDLGDPYKLTRHYQTAARLRSEAANPALNSYVTAYHALASGPIPAAIDYARQALDTAPKTTTHLTRSWLCAVAATVTAPADPAEATRLLGHARDHFDAAEGREEWMYEFDHTALAGYRGQCHLQLGQPTAAIAAFTEGIDSVPATCVRRKAQFTLGLAEAHLDSGDIDQALRMASASLRVFAARGSVSGMRAVRRLRNLLHEGGHTRHAAQLDEQAHATVKADH
ncbi:helix-turn-helix domain-containing protein [Actinomadura sp. SCN-SB]|uniref:helix-turn-helix domain-containing protein n=1 Tax=Actinomadura sp. SCN-SB TaxID=3373092 RepID=UPI003753C0D7